MKGTFSHTATLSFATILSSIFFINASAPGVYAQETGGAAPAANPPAAAAAAAPAPPSNTAAPKADDVKTRLTHARALAATGNFTAAVSELETARRDAREDSVRDVARVLLMSVHLKMGNYTRSRELLEEAFASRTASQAGGTNIYFALVGQMLNNVRARLDRYREFGLSTADTTLPIEAQNDLGHLRLLLERLVEQAKLMREEHVANADSIALFEDAASVRLMVARNDAERTHWQQELAEARQRLAASNTRTTGNAPRNTTAPAATSPGATSPGVTATTGKAGDVTPANVPASAGATNNKTAAPPAAAPGPTANSPAAKSTTTSAAPTTTPSSPPASTPPASTPPASTPPPTRPAPQPDTKSTGAATTTVDPVAIGSLHEMATQRVSPTYPPVARTAGVSGVVTVYLLVNETGSVESVKSASGPAQLQQAATEAARRWKFRQTLVDGQPVRVTGYVSFSFTP